LGCGPPFHSGVIDVEGAGVSETAAQTVLFIATFGGLPAIYVLLWVVVRIVKSRFPDA
jgi:hypothetical protein